MQLTLARQPALFAFAALRHRAQVAVRPTFRAHDFVEELLAIATARPGNDGSALEPGRPKYSWDMTQHSTGKFASRAGLPRRPLALAMQVAWHRPYSSQKTMFASTLMTPRDLPGTSSHSIVSSSTRPRVSIDASGEITEPLHRNLARGRAHALNVHESCGWHGRGSL